MFDFTEEGEAQEQRLNPDRCKLCGDTGKYWINNIKTWYTCYACDANEKLSNEKTSRTKQRD